MPGYCKQDHEIDNYIKDLVVSIWAVYDEMDFGEFDQMPVFRTSDNFVKTLVKKG